MCHTGVATCNDTDTSRRPCLAGTRACLSIRMSNADGDMFASNDRECVCQRIMHRSLSLTPAPSHTPARYRARTSSTSKLVCSFCSKSLAISTTFQIPIFTQPHGASKRHVLLLDPWTLMLDGTCVQVIHSISEVYQYVQQINTEWRLLYAHALSRRLQ